MADVDRRGENNKRLNCRERFMTQQIPPSFQKGLQAFGAGRLQDAEVAFRQFLTESPNHPDGIHMLGLVAYRSGKNEIAADLISRAIRLAPNIAEYRGNLGMVLATMRRLDEAISTYRQALAI